MERLLWARLSVFRSDATVDDVEQVCLGGPFTGSVLESALAGLRRKSLVTLYGDRLRMLDTVREYGHMWLRELGEARATADRHARHFHDLVVAAEDAWWGPGQAAAYERLAACFGDLRAALEHLLAAAMTGGSASSGRAAAGAVCADAAVPYGPTKETPEEELSSATGFRGWRGWIRRR
ncbi:hypothetical protein ACWGK1_02135 [Streptomyces wedmorensis]